MSRFDLIVLKKSLSACALLCVGVAAFAQNAPQGATPSAPAAESAPQKIAAVKQEVTVTATRTPLSTDATASSVRTLSSEELRQSPGVVLDDRLRQIPGLELYRRTSSLVNNPTTQGISLRGLGSTAASRTLALSDEVPMSDPFGGWIHWDEVPRLAISTVEVLRGGASDLYGSSAIGGVINEVPVRAQESRAEIDGGYGGQQTGFGDGIWIGGNELLHGLAAASILHTAGYTTTTPVSRGVVDIPAGVHAESGRIELRHGTAERDIFLRGNVLNEARSNGTPVTKNGTRLWRYAGGADQPVGAGHAFLRLYGSDQRYRQTFSTVNTTTPPRGSEFLNRIQRVPSQEMGGAAQWAQTFHALTVVAGADVRDIRATDVETTYNASGAATGTTNISARQRGAGFYGELLWNRGPWSAALSGRVDNFQTFDVHKVGTAAPLASKSETVFDPRLGLVRHIGSSFALSGSVFRAFRGPTQNELYRNSQVGSQLTQAPATNTLLSERATGFELGAEVEAKKLGTVRGSYFWTEINRPITAVLVSQTSTSQTLQRVNLGQIRSRGISLDFVSHPQSWLQLSGGYQFAFATVTSFSADTTLVGKWIPEVPRNAATLQMRVEKRQIGTLNLVARNTGRVFDDSANSQLLHGFFRLDLYAEHEFGRRFSVYGSAENLFDRRIEAGRTPLLTLGTPRTGLMGIRVHFN